MGRVTETSRSSKADRPEKAFLFQCGVTGVFAASWDPAGANLPLSSCSDGWFRRDWMLLSPSGPFAPPINPEFLVAGLLNDGYYIWEAPQAVPAHWSRPRAEPENLTFAIVNGPSNPELLRAVAWSRQGHTVAFDLGDELLKVVVLERAELATANRMSFAIRGYFASGAVKGKRFEGVYDCGTGRGYLLIGEAAVHCP